MRHSRHYIIGAGFSGQAIARDLLRHYQADILAFLDDDRRIIGTDIQNIPVLGPIQPAIRSLDTDAQVIIAIPNLSQNDLHILYSTLKSHGFSDILILPNTSQLLTATGSMILTREIDPADFLGRSPIVLEMKKTLAYLKGKRVLVTGAGGSIGSELARQLLLAESDRLYLLGHGENSIYQIHKELKKLQSSGIDGETQIVPIIGELQDPYYLEFLMKRLQVDMIFHCAAHKHVPLMEDNPVEVMKNNAFVVHYLVEAAKKAKVPHFILVSTDKAVDPYNIYGVSKALCESIVLNAHKDGQDGFVLVRFGNVLGSRGSIIPLLKEQIIAGGPITITHKDMQRYFMTIPEAVSLVLLAGGCPSVTGRYLLEMGEPVRILDLAYQMCQFYNIDPDKNEIAIEFIGMRPGEKLDEKLYSDYEIVEPTEWERLLNIKDKGKQPSVNVEEILEKIRDICFYNKDNTENYRNRHILRDILRRYYPSLEEKTDEPVF
ncbi:MAG: polysaccharide biosynthesis protein [Spirochaetia bacterium]